MAVFSKEFVCTQLYQGYISVASLIFGYAAGYRNKIEAKKSLESKLQVKISRYDANNDVLNNPWSHKRDTEKANF